MASSNCYCPFSFRDSVVWPSNYGFWLPLWRLQAFLVLFHLVIVLSGLHITASDYPFWHLQTFLVLFLVVIVLSGLPISASDYPFGIFKLFLSFFFWLLCCLAFKLRLMITPLASSSFSCPFSFGYCVVWPSHYGFWLPIWRLQTFLVLFLLVIVLSGLQITASDYLFGVFKLFLSFFLWLLCCLAFQLRFWLPLWHLQTFLILFLLVIVLSGLQKYGFWLPLWCLQAFLVLFRSVIVLSGLQITASDYPFGVFKLFLSFFFWLLCCLAFKLRLLIIPLVSSSFSCPFSFGYCVVWPSNYGFWLSPWRLQAFLVLFPLVILLSGLPITLMFTRLASSSFSCPFSFGYCVVWPSNYAFWLPLWRLQAFLVLFLLVIVLSGPQITASDSPFWHLQTFLALFLLVIVLSGL